MIFSLENMYKDMASCHLQKQLEINMEKKTNGYSNKNRIKCCKNCF